jgi:hypothetical protein
MTTSSGDWDQQKYEAAVAAGMPRLPGDGQWVAPVSLDSLVLAYTERMAGQSRQGIADNLREFAAKIARRQDGPTREQLAKAIHDAVWPGCPNQHVMYADGDEGVAADAAIALFTKGAES